MPRTVYKDDDHEIDIEMSRWAGGYGPNKTAVSPRTIIDGIWAAFFQDCWQS